MPPTRTHTPHRLRTIYNNTHIYTQTVWATLLSYSDGSPSEAENFDVFTARVINHKPPIKCQLELWHFFLCLEIRWGVQQISSDNELSLIV